VPYSTIDTRTLDNAVMIGWASMHRFLSEDTDEYSILIRPKWSIDDSAEDIDAVNPNIKALTM
jgi:tRNA A37 threonylcarbamoyltransferase TsaD